MVNVQSSGIVAQEMFTGAYNKRVEQNKAKAAAEAYHAQNRTTQTAKEALGATVEISQESKDFLAGVAERKAAQAAAQEEIKKEYSGNAFVGTGDFKQQYLVFSESLYNNGFYDSMSDEEVLRMENLLKNITSGMDSINGSGLNVNRETEMSHEAARLDLVSSVNALKYFAEKYVPEDMQDSFKDLINQYESYNTAKVAAHKNIYDMRDESMKNMPAPNAVNVSETVKKMQENTKAGMEIGRVTHTEEEEAANKADYQALFDKLIREPHNADTIFADLKDTLVNYAAGGSKNSNVLALLNSRNTYSINNMFSYWSGLL